MRVRINEDLTLTAKNFSVVSDMKVMKGKIYDVEEWVNNSTPYYVVNGWNFDKRDCTIVDDYELIDDTKLDGFVVDLSTTEKIYYALESVIHSIEDRIDIYRTMDIAEIRDFILEYYTTNYNDSYILVKAPNVYQIVEEDLYVKRG